MSIFTRKQPDLQLVRDIESDVRDFVQNELILYHAGGGSGQQDSVIANLALFDLSSLLTEQGFSQMEKLFGDSHGQLVGRRILQLRHTLYIRYGDAVRDVERRSIDGLVSVYGLRKRDTELVAGRLPGLWLVPFIRQAYNAIEIELLSVRKTK